MRKTIWLSEILVWALAIFLSPKIFADGTIDIRINPATGVAISEPGSYKLVESVAMTANVVAVTFAAGSDDATLDLNGQTITAFAGSTTNGIDAGSRNNVTIFNGTVKNFGVSAVSVGARGCIKNVRAEGNRSGGVGILRGGQGATIQDCTVANSSSTSSIIGIQGNSGTKIFRNLIDNNDSTSNNSIAIFCSFDSCQIIDNVIRDNNSAAASALAAIAIEAAANAIVRGNTISNHDHAGSGVVRGINAGVSSIIESNILMSNNGAAAVYGISASGDCVILSNTVNDSDSTAGQAWGIYAASGCRLEGNTVFGTNGTIARGIETTGNGIIRGNVCRMNQAIATGTQGVGIMAGSGSLIEDNECVDNRDAANVSSTGYGINAASGSTVRGNVCVGNGANGTDGSGIGIVVTTDSLVESNRCENNDAGTLGFSAGIWVLLDRNRVIENYTSNQSGGTAAHGILVEGSDNLIAQNTTSSNATRGITVTGAGNRTRQNESSDAAISGGSGLVGDLADIAF